jgi:hypothetical protein
MEHNAIRHDYVTTLKILSFETNKGDLKEWMTEALETDRHGQQEWNPTSDYLPAPSENMGKDDQRTDEEGELDHRF